MKPTAPNLELKSSPQRRTAVGGVVLSRIHAVAGAPRFTRPTVEPARRSNFILGFCSPFCAATHLGRSAPQVRGGAPSRVKRGAPTAWFRLKTCLLLAVLAAASWTTPVARAAEIKPVLSVIDDQKTVSPEGLELLRQWRKNTPFGTVSFNLEGLRSGMGARNEPRVAGTKLFRVKVGEIPCEWVLAPGADPDLRLLYLHGGGWVSGSGGNYLPLAANISAAAKCAVLLPDYRLAPEHRFPAGLEDCVSAHEWMIANGPTGPAAAQATFIAGDSAGGNLTLATLLALRDRKRQLPAAGIPLSAATDFTLASESLQTVADPVISARAMPVFREHYLAKTDPRTPLASPVFGDYHGIPPLLIQVGAEEMLRDDSIRVAKKARADGLPVTLEVWPGMVHVFQIRELPESREAVEHIAAFMRAQLPK